MVRIPIWPHAPAAYLPSKEWHCDPPSCPSQKPRRHLRWLPGSCHIQSSSPLSLPPNSPSPTPGSPALASSAVSLPSSHTLGPPGVPLCLQHPHLPREPWKGYPAGPALPGRPRPICSALPSAQPRPGASPPSGFYAFSWTHSFVARGRSRPEVGALWVSGFPGGAGLAAGLRENSCPRACCPPASARAYCAQAVSRPLRAEAWGQPRKDGLQEVQTPPGPSVRDFLLKDRVPQTPPSCV